MNSVFLSYAREDKFLVGELAYALTREGWNVWWDSEVLPGQEFTREIERELTAARCVVVIWSRHSVDSPWVRDEARNAAARGILVPVIVEDVAPPLGLQGCQYADLRKWDGTVSHPGCAALVREFHPSCLNRFFSRDNSQLLMKGKDFQAEVVCEESK